MMVVLLITQIVLNNMSDLTVMKKEVTKMSTAMTMLTTTTATMVNKTELSTIFSPITYSKNANNSLPGNKTKLDTTFPSKITMATTTMTEMTITKGTNETLHSNSFPDTINLPKDVNLPPGTYDVYQRPVTTLPNSSSTHHRRTFRRYLTNTTKLGPNLRTFLQKIRDIDMLQREYHFALNTAGGTLEKNAISIIREIYHKTSAIYYYYNKNNTLDLNIPTIPNLFF